MPSSSANATFSTPSWCPRKPCSRPERDYENALYEYERSSLNAAKATKTTPISGTILRLARDANHLPVADGQLVAAGFQVAEIAPARRIDRRRRPDGPGTRPRPAGPLGPHRPLRVSRCFADRRGGPPLPPCSTRSSTRSAPRWRSPTTRVSCDRGCSSRSPWSWSSAPTSAWCHARPSPTAAARASFSILDGQRVSRRDVRLGARRRRQDPGARRTCPRRPHRGPRPRNADRRHPCARHRRLSVVEAVRS